MYNILTWGCVSASRPSPQPDGEPGEAAVLGAGNSVSTWRVTVRPGSGGDRRGPELSEPPLPLSLTCFRRRAADSATPSEGSHHREQSVPLNPANCCRAPSVGVQR